LSEVVGVADGQTVLAAAGHLLGLLEQPVPAVGGLVDAGRGQHVLVVGHDERAAGERDADLVVLVRPGDAERRRHEAVAAADRVPVIGRELGECLRRVGRRGERGAQRIDVRTLAGQHRRLNLRELFVGRGERLEVHRRAGVLLERVRHVGEPLALLVGEGVVDANQHVDRFTGAVGGVAAVLVLTAARGERS
jgi:hypothetical protein